MSRSSCKPRRRCSRNSRQSPTKTGLAGFATEVSSCLASPSCSAKPRGCSCFRNREVSPGRHANVRRDHSSSCRQLHAHPVPARPAEHRGHVRRVQCRSRNSCTRARRDAAHYPRAPGDPDIDYVVKLAEPVPLRKTRWARKLLQMGKDDTSLVTGFEAISGLARPKGSNASLYSVDFLDQQHWDFRRGSQILLRTRFGEAKLPQEVMEAIASSTISTGSFRTRMEARRTGSASSWTKSSSSRMAACSWSRRTRGAKRSASSAKARGRAGPAIHGADRSSVPDRRDHPAGPDGLCHAIGVILDGPANDECTPSRGAAVTIRRSAMFTMDRAAGWHS